MTATERLKSEIQEEMRSDRAQSANVSRRTTAVNQVISFVSQGSWACSIDEVIDAAKRFDVFLETGK
ncbi:hypothetical protein [Gluconobacter oxydans]|uniref:hypothetical protein n=1 Tax=Gluconobacter oxydans TaxID=442 RepID=UPI00346475C4